MRRIMLIDDNKIDLFIHSEIIRRMPFEKEILQYSYAGEALEFLKNANAAEWPEVILLDIYMPILNGFDFLKEYISLPVSSRNSCRVIMVSSSLDAGDLKKANQNQDVFGFLEKPLNMEKLFQMVKP